MTNRQQQVQALEAYNLTFIRLLPGEKRPKENNWTSLPLGNVSQLDLYGSYYNLGVLAGREINKNEFLLILDIDPRNGGSIEAIEKAVGTLPDTLTIKTASGGWHYYFVSETALPKCADVLPGVDILGVGSQAVAAGSKLKDGRIYEISNNPGYIEKTPHALERLISNHKKNEKKKPNPITTIKSGRNNYLTSIAGKLRASGLDEDAIYHALLAIDLKQCEPPLQSDDDETPPGLKQIEAIARSISRKSFDPIDVEAATIPRFKPDEIPQPGEFKLTSKTTIDFNARFQEIIDMTSGLVFDIASDVGNSAYRYYPGFALASAFGMVSAVAQGGLSPSQLFDNSVKGSVGFSMYNVLIGGSSVGKDHYLKCNRSALRTVNAKMIAPDFGSVQAMIEAFFICNNLVTFKDEFQDYIANLSQAKTGYLNQILSLMKQLSGNLESIAPQVTKGKMMPEIKSPRYSIFSVGTSFIDAVKDGNVSGGLASRLTIWPMGEEVATGKTKIKEFKLRKHIEDGLRDILTYGMAAGFELDPFDQHDLIKKFIDGRLKDKDGKQIKRIEHQPAFEQERGAGLIGFNRDAADLLEAYRIKQENTFKYTFKEDLSNNSEMSPGSVEDRASGQAIRFACLHAIANNRKLCNRLDAEIGIALASLLSDFLIDEVKSQTMGNQLAVKITKYLSKQAKPVSVGRIRSSSCRTFDISEIHKVTVELVVAGTLGFVGKGGQIEPVDSQDLLKRKTMPNGCKVFLKSNLCTN